MRESKRWHGQQGCESRFCAGTHSTRQRSKSALTSARQVQDDQTGEVQYFEWPCRGAQDSSANGLALDFPPQCPQRQTGLGFHKGTCFADSADSCALCITGDGVCKPTLGSTTIKKVRAPTFGACEERPVLLNGLVGEVFVAARARRWTALRASTTSTSCTSRATPATPSGSGASPCWPRGLVSE